MDKSARLMLVFAVMLLLRPGRAEAVRVSHAARNPAFQSSAAMRAALRPSSLFRTRFAAFQSSPEMRQAFARSPGFGASSELQQLFKGTRRTAGHGGRSTQWRIGQFSP